MVKAIKIRIYPNKEQINYINRQLGCCRFVYNKCLDHKKTAYEKDKTSISSTDIIKYLVSLKDEFGFLKEAHSKVLQQSIRDMNTAYENFFKHNAGYPNFKAKHANKQSCRFPKDAIIGIRGNRIDLIKCLKDIHFKCSHRDEIYLNKRQSSIHSITLSKTRSDKYYLSVLIDFIPEVKQSTGTAIGFDLGIKDFIITSDGRKLSNKHFYIKEEKRLKHLNRMLSKKQKGSHNKDKARIKVAKLNEKIANRRNNYIQQVTSMLINENQVICMEDLNAKGMMHNHKLAKHIQDAGFGMLSTILEYKCKLYNRDLIKIDRFYPSSKRCNHCGYINKELTLSDREWVCPDCGAVIDRDYNAALNILEEGLRLYHNDKNRVELTQIKAFVEDPTMDDRDATLHLKSSDPLKQEKKMISIVYYKNQSYTKFVETHKCCLCGKEFNGYGNNPEPVMYNTDKDGNTNVCCDDCNINKVIPARMKAMFNC